MKKILLAGALIVTNAIFAQITIDDSYDAQGLVEDVLIGNPNFMASNFVLSTGTNFGDVNGVAAYEINGADFPFSGIVLTSGSVFEVPGPNLTTNNDGGSGWPGDADLEAVTGVAQTNNASWLQFDFVAAGPLISMEFILASEEYNQNFECTFADTFAVILTENAGGSSQNVALLPSSTEPIQVINVHPEVPGSCAAQNEVYFDKYNFEPFNVAADATIDYNGQTTTFMILAELFVGESYTMKIVIADAIDTSYDSALFVRGNSFGTFPVIGNEPNDLQVLDPNGDGFAVFDLTVNETLILADLDPTAFSFLYYESLADAEAGVNPIAIPTAYTNTTNPQTIYFRMTNVYTDAFIIGDFEIEAVTELGVEDTVTNSLILFPNPTSEMITIQSNFLASEVAVTIFSLHGQQVISETKTPSNGIVQLDVSTLDSGVYFVRIASEGNSVIKKLIKK